MKRYSTVDLRCRDIVNLCDGARLGYANDFEFETDGECAHITALIICGSSGFFGLGREEDLVIPWKAVQCIGEDTILVKLSAQEISACSCRRERRYRR